MGKPYRPLSQISNRRVEAHEQAWEFAESPYKAASLQGFRLLWGLGFIYP